MQLIKIDNRQIAQQSAQTVNARELHASLEVGKDFSNWVKAQITRARLVENRDFVKVAQKGELSSTGQTVIEYHLTIEAAKHIAMVSGTDKGFEVREYFIECERRTKEMPAPMSLQDALGDPEMVRGMLLVYTNKVIALQKQVTEQAPKVQALDLIATESARAPVDLPPCRWQRLHSLPGAHSGALSGAQGHHRGAQRRHRQDGRTGAGYAQGPSQAGR